MSCNKQYGVYFMMPGNFHWVADNSNTNDFVASKEKASELAELIQEFTPWPVVVKLYKKEL